MADFCECGFLKGEFGQIVMFHDTPAQVASPYYTNAATVLLFSTQKNR